MENLDKPTLGLALSESSLEDLKAKLEKEDFLSLGKALQKLEASQPCQNSGTIANTCQMEGHTLGSAASNYATMIQR